MEARQRWVDSTDSRKADRRRAVVSRLMWLAGICGICAGVGLRAGWDCALIAGGSLVWGEYFVGGILELVTSRRGAG
jgi:phage shock protein PspC (stress-responsive transcriptional regulator)